MLRNRKREREREKSNEKRRRIRVTTNVQLCTERNRYTIRFLPPDYDPHSHVYLPYLPLHVFYITRVYSITHLSSVRNIMCVCMRVRMYTRTMMKDILISPNYQNLLNFLRYSGTYRVPTYF